VGSGCVGGNWGGGRKEKIQGGVGTHEKKGGGTKSAARGIDPTEKEGGCKKPVVMVMDIKGSAQPGEIGGHQESKNHNKERVEA